MRHCQVISYPRRDEYNSEGVKVRTVALKPVKCPNVATTRASNTWPNGERQHNYVCDDHVEHLRKILEAADFPFEPHPYAPQH